MKKLLLITIAAFALAACEKSQTELNEPLVGKWLDEKMLQEEEAYSIWEFTNDFQAILHYGRDLHELDQSTFAPKYTIDKSKLYFYRDLEKGSDPEEVTYKLKGDGLYFNDRKHTRVKN